MAHTIERATSARSKCRGCGERIANGDLRLGERLPNPFGDEGQEMTHWFHLACAAYRRPQPFLDALATTEEPIEDRETLEREATAGVQFHRLPRCNSAERAATGRAACRQCKEPIAKDSWRISLLYYEDGRFSPSGYVHPKCAAAFFETADIMPRVRRFSPALGEEDLAEIQKEIVAL
jgi:hypothetical protein